MWSMSQKPWICCTSPRGRSNVLANIGIFSANCGGEGRTGKKEKKKTLNYLWFHWCPPLPPFSPSIFFIHFNKYNIITECTKCTQSIMDTQILLVRNMIFKAQPTMTVISEQNPKMKHSSKNSVTLSTTSPKQHIHRVDSTEQEKSFKSRVVAYFLRVNLSKNYSTLFWHHFCHML